MKNFFLCLLFVVATVAARAAEPIPESLVGKWTKSEVFTERTDVEVDGELVDVKSAVTTFEISAKGAISFTAEYWSDEEKKNPVTKKVVKGTIELGKAVDGKIPFTIKGDKRSNQGWLKIGDKELELVETHLNGKKHDRERPLTLKKCPIDL